MHSRTVQNAPQEPQAITLEPSSATVEVEKARRELAILKSSLSYRLGALLVDLAKSLSSPAEVPKLAWRAGASLWGLWQCAQIDGALFSGLARSGMQAEACGAGALRDIRRLKRLVANYRPTRETTQALRAVAHRATSSWPAQRANTALEFDTLAREGMTLPQPAPRRAQGEPSVLYLVKADPASLTNGYTQRTHEIVSGVSGLGWKITPVVVSAEAQRALAVSYGGATYHRLGAVDEDLVSLSSYVDRMAEKVVRLALKERPAVIHAASNYIVGLTGAVAARRLGLPFVYEARGLWELTRLSTHPEFEASLGFRVQAILEAQVAAAADRLIIQNFELGEEFARRGCDPRKMALAPSGAPTRPHLSASMIEEVRSRFGLTQRFVVGYVGSLVTYEGLSTLIRSFSSMSPREREDMELLIVGEGAARQSLEAQARDGGVSQKIRFSGRVEPELARKAYAALDLAVFPRHSTRVTNVVAPLKHLEAAAAGTPMIVSDVRPLQNFADVSSSALCVPAGNAEALRTAILKVCRDRDLAKRLRGAGLAYTEKLTWKNTAASVVAVYNDVLDAPSSREACAS